MPSPDADANAATPSPDADPSAPLPAFDAIVLAGGTASRLDGVSKPDVELAGRRLLDHTLAATAGAGRVVVVAPESVAVPHGVVRTLEDPPHGGPVAGLAAGLAALDGHPAGGTGTAPLLLVLSCDVPFVAGAVPRLLAAAGEGADGACLRDASGYLQWLVAVYRTDALRGRLDALASGRRGSSVRALVAPLRLAAVAARGKEAADVDTWADLDALD
ncbi:NTP transferase domain-containing protein [Georgenia thermotolerans]|uniref:NTP transferase domain-containing protein n=2 Tax=Georgenia thermotolerans TaxID=527326 RepID=A0A7J5ULU1_9MICO|nr:NTP transferase domain-containing protein [Georgenia thermotolerans]